MPTLSILKKVTMAITGLLWAGFLVSHVSGNFLLYKGPEAFNGYSEMLHKLGGLLYLAEAGLVAFLALHIVSGIQLTLRNRAARPQPYGAARTNGKATLFSRSMIVGGLLIAIFIPLHVASFKYGDMSGPDGLYGLVVRSFGENKAMAAWYVLVMIAVGMHLAHGLGSAFQTLGVGNAERRTLLRKAGLAVGWAIALGFMSMPIYFGFLRG